MVAKPSLAQSTPNAIVARTMLARAEVSKCWMSGLIPALRGCRRIQVTWAPTARMRSTIAVCRWPTPDRSRPGREPTYETRPLGVSNEQNQGEDRCRRERHVAGGNRTVRGYPRGPVRATRPPRVQRRTLGARRPTSRSLKEAGWPKGSRRAEPLQDDAPVATVPILRSPPPSGQRRVGKPALIFQSEVAWQSVEHVGKPGKR